MILISSGAYVVHSLISEVGNIPPSFLPIGNKRLYEYQVELLEGLNDDIYLSIPESYELSPFDKAKLYELSVNIIEVADGISLGASLVYSWLSTGKKYENLVVLFGDTLFSDLNVIKYKNSNAFSVHHNKGLYSRATLESINAIDKGLSNQLITDDSLVISGLFSFLKPHVLMQSIIKNDNNFISGLSQYKNNNHFHVDMDGKWYDFGHLNSFFLSRSEMTTQRSFNSLKISDRTVRKSSAKKNKMLAESYWFDNIPMPLRLHTPIFLKPYSEDGKGNASYELEYLYLLPLNDLFVFSRLPFTYWERILNECKVIILDLKKSSDKDLIDKNLAQIANKIFLEKSISRVSSIKGKSIEKYIQSYGFEVFFKDKVGSNLSVEEILYAMNELIPETKMENMSIVHGDFCFSNILYDSKVQSLKVLDPRGLNMEGELSIYGDARYDIAKLYHSVIGYYDLIIAGRFNLNDNIRDFYTDDFMHSLEESFDKIFFDSGMFVKKEILAINVMLFLSMIPLHADNYERQKAMFANAIRLFNKIKAGE